MVVVLYYIWEHCNDIDFCWHLIDFSEWKPWRNEFFLIFQEFLGISQKRHFCHPEICSIESSVYTGLLGLRHFTIMCANPTQKMGQRSQRPQIFWVFAEFWAFLCLKGVSEKTSHFDCCIYQLSVHYLLSSQEIYLFPLKIEVRPVVFHMITFYSSNYGLRYTQQSLYFTLEIWNNEVLSYQSL